MKQLKYFTTGEQNCSLSVEVSCHLEANSYNRWIMSKLSTTAYSESDKTQGARIVGRLFTLWAIKESPLCVVAFKKKFTIL